MGAVAIVGSAEVTVTPNAAGFGPKTEAAIKAALAGVSAQINLTLDENHLREKIAAAVATAGAGQDIDIEANIDVDSFSEKVRRAAAVVDDIEIPTSIDGDGLEGELRRLITVLEATNEVNIRAHFDNGSGGEADRVGAAAGGIFGRAVLRTALRVVAAGGLAQLFTAATAGAVALAGGLISASSAAGTLLATVSVLPGILSAAAQAAGTIGLALGGIKGTFQAYTSMQKAIGKQAAGGSGGGDGGAAAARAAEKAIRNATRGVEDAYRSAAEAVEAATERISDAGRNLVRAQRDQQEAQENLTRARVEAREEADDLRRSVERLSLTEAEARRRLSEARIKTALAEKRAQQDLTGVTEDTLRALERQAAIEDKATFDPHQKALNDLRDAELDLEEATGKRVDAQKKLTEFDSTGVEGTKKVIEAKQRLADADERVSDQERDLTKAQRDLVKAQEDGARRIADAQENLADAIASAAEKAAGAAGGAAGAINAFEAALDRLSPAARHFVEFLIGLEPVLRRVQATAAAGLFPGLEQAITTLLPLVNDLEPIIGLTAKAIAGLAIEGANLIASPGFRGDLVTIGKRNIDIIEGLGRAAISLVDGLRHITIAAGPLTQHLVDITEHFASMAQEALAAGRANGSLEAFFGRVQIRLDRLIVTAKFLGTGLFRVFRDAVPAGDRYLDTLTLLAARFDTLTERASRSGALKDFFESTRPAVEAIGHLLGDIAVGLAHIGTDNFRAFTVFADQLRTELLPVLVEVLDTIDTNFLSSLVSVTAAFAHLFGAVLVGNPTLTLLLNSLADLGHVVSSLLTDIPVLSPILQGVVTAFGALAVIGAVQTLRQFASSAFGMEKALISLTGSADAAALAETRVGRAAAFAGDLMSKAFLVAGLIYAVRNATESLVPSIDKVVEATLRAKDPLATFEQGLRNLANPSVLDRLKIGLNEFTHGGFIAGFESITNIVGATRKALEGMGEKGNEAFRKLAEQSTATATRIIADAKAQGKNTQDYERILSELITEQAKHGIATAEVQKRIDAETRALQGNTTSLEENTRSMRDATNQALSLSGASISTEEAFDRLTTSLEENGRTFDIGTEKGRQNKRALDDLVGSIQREIEELGKAAAAGQFDNNRKQELIDHLNELSRSGYPGAEQAAGRLRGELEAIHPVYNATVDIDTAAAERRLRALVALLNLVRFQPVNVGDFNTEGREFGGRVLRNQAYVVGERRPELFIPDKDGVILPQLPDMAEPKATALPGFDFAPSAGAFDTAGVSSLLDDLESKLTDQLSTLQDIDAERRAAGAQQQPATGTTVEQTITGPLVTIEATFGPGSSAADLIDALRAVAKDEIAVTLAQVLKDHAAGAGTR